MKKLTLGLAVAMSLASITHAAMSLNEKKKWDEHLTTITDSNLKPMNEKCATKMTFEYKTDSFAKWNPSNSIEGYCSAPIDAMWTMCDDAASKKAIAAKIKKVTCKMGPKEKIELKLSGSTLEFTIGEGAANVGDVAKQWLGDHL